MANPEHLKILKQGVEVWNNWRTDNLALTPDLSAVDLTQEKYFQANFSATDFKNATLTEAQFNFCNFSKAKFENTSLNLAVLYSSDFSGSEFINANFLEAQFIRANLSGCVIKKTPILKANFSSTDLSFAIFENLNIIQSSFYGANLRGTGFTETQIIAADLEGAILIKTKFVKTSLSNIRVYGIAAWDIIKEEISQESLIITPQGVPTITIEDIEVAQFIYLLLNNQNIRNVIDTITSKAVLILGRFTEERKKVLDALKDDLRKRNYLPIVFDFEPSQNRNLTETVSILAKMSCFVIADITDPRSIPQELYAIVPTTPLLPIVPIILGSQHEYGMFESFIAYRSVLPIYRYVSQEQLLENITSAIIAPAEQKVKELREKIA